MPQRFPNCEWMYLMWGNIPSLLNSLLKPETDTVVLSANYFVLPEEILNQLLGKDFCLLQGFPEQWYDREMH